MTLCCASFWQPAETNKQNNNSYVNRWNLCVERLLSANHEQKKNRNFNKRNLPMFITNDNISCSPKNDNTIIWPSNENWLHARLRKHNLPIKLINSIWRASCATFRWITLRPHQVWRTKSWADGNWFMAQMAQLGVIRFCNTIFPTWTRTPTIRNTVVVT